MGRKDRAALRRIIALLFAFADLAEATCGRSRPARWLVLTILGLAETTARDYVGQLTGLAPFVTPTKTPVEPNCSRAGESVPEATRLAFVFRMLAAALAALPHDAAVSARARFMELRAVCALRTRRNIMAAHPIEPQNTS